MMQRFVPISSFGFAIVLTIAATPGPHADAADADLTYFVTPIGRIAPNSYARSFAKAINESGQLIGEDYSTLLGHRNFLWIDGATLPITFAEPAESFGRTV